MVGTGRERRCRMSRKHLAALHAANEPVALIVLTGRSDEAIGLEAVRKGAQDYLPKARLGGPELVPVLPHMLERRRAQEKLRETEGQLRQPESHSTRQVVRRNTSKRVSCVLSRADRMAVEF